MTIFVGYAVKDTLLITKKERILRGMTEAGKIFCSRSPLRHKSMLSRICGASVAYSDSHAEIHSIRLLRITKVKSHSGQRCRDSMQGSTASDKSHLLKFVMIRGN